jgi:quinoprotein glucose dehydrogenase
LIDFTPELRQEALAIVKEYVTGPLFTPPSIRGTGPNATKGTIQLPGSVGGADWQGAASMPRPDSCTSHRLRRRLLPTFYQEIRQDESSVTRGTREWIGGPEACRSFKPPYGRITAIDLNRGEHRWMVANG